MYIVGGFVEIRQLTNSIEKLDDIDAPNSQASSGWQQIVTHQSFLPREHPVVCALNDREVIILGGKTGNGNLGDGWVIDSQTDTMTQVIAPNESSPKFYSDMNLSDKTYRDSLIM